MAAYLLQAWANGLGVLSSVATRMPAGGRAKGALFAGTVPAVPTFAVTAALSGATT